VNAAEITGTPSTDIVEDLKLFQEFASNITKTNFDGIALDSLAALYPRRQEIPQILDACNVVSHLEFDQETLSSINTDSLQNIDECKPLVEQLSRVFETEIPLRQLRVSDLQAPKHELQTVIGSFQELQAVHDRLQDLVSLTSIWSKIGLNKQYGAAKEKFREDLLEVWGYMQDTGNKPDQLLAQIGSLQADILNLKKDTPYALEFIYSLARQSADFSRLTAALNELNSLKFDNILSAIAFLEKKDKHELTLKELSEGLVFFFNDTATTEIYTEY